MKTENLIGKKFGKLTVVDKVGKDKYGYFLWKCICDCGNEKDLFFSTTQLKNNKLLSCGCLNQTKLCKVEGCKNKHYGLGYCEKHHKEYKKYGHIRTEQEIEEQKHQLSLKRTKERTQNNKCDFCDKKGYFSKNFNHYFCLKHYNQYKKYGEVLKRTRFDPNEIIIYDTYAEVILYNKDNEETGRAVIDLDDIEKIKKHKWHLDDKGYAQTSSKHPYIQMHNYIMNNVPFEKFVDHINRNRLDNRKQNLRFCTHQENNMNNSIRKHSKTQVRGIEYMNHKYYAYIGFNNQKIHLGSFQNIEDAIEARKDAELKYFGKFAPCLSDDLIEKNNILITDERSN